MTRLRIAALFVAVVAGDYAALMLIDGQLIDFGVAAAICAASSVAAGLIAYADDQDARRQHEVGRRRRKAVTRRRAAIWHPDRQATTPPGRRCLLCGVAHQTESDSPRFADRQEARLCGACASAPTQTRHDEPTAGLGASSDGRAIRSGSPRRGKSRRGVTWNRIGWRRTPDELGVKVAR
jgi:hypothetical protein